MDGIRWLQLLAVVVAALLPQVGEGQGLDAKISPQMFALPEGNIRSAEPYETRVYPTDDKGNPIRSGLDKYDKSYPIIVDKQPGKQYKLEDKGAVFHAALDITSRPGPGKRPVPLDFKAGVYGTVLRARGTDGVILVQLPDGTILHYLHTSKAYVQPGQKITPNTVLGKTGKVGTGVIHLHLQATDLKGKLIDVDKAFLAGRKPDLWTAVDWKSEHWVDFKPNYQRLPKPKVVDGVVSAAGKITYDDAAPKEKTRAHWVAGTSWGGYVQGSSDGRDWKSSNAFVVTFNPDGKCNFLYGMENKSPQRLATTWRAQGKNVVLAKFLGKSDIVLPMPDQKKKESLSEGWSSGAWKRRIELRKEWGLKRQLYRGVGPGYDWILGYKNCDYMRANP